MTDKQHSPFGSEITSEQVVATMKTFTTWEQRYRQVVQWGKLLPKMADEQKSAQVMVSGCESQVWLVCELADGVWHIQADSDARIVRGLIALVLAAYQGKSNQAIQLFDIKDYFAQMGLIEHLSPSRSNGLMAIIAEIQKIAAAE
ncbi:SufE family protein [Vibrio profundum]|uniref:SufE family protein n=1 Tax=Vibrio profundum TaxID=2910247 RepID=UPI003D106C2C